jgi:peptidoglycan hydrolase CwlO-like protein
MKKRIVLLLSVVALMVVMLATSVAPAFAGEKLWNCVRLEPRDSQQVDTKEEKNDLEAQGYVCEKQKKPKQG